MTKSMHLSSVRVPKELWDRLERASKTGVYTIPKTQILIRGIELALREIEQMQMIAGEIDSKPLDMNELRRVVSGAVRSSK